MSLLLGLMSGTSMDAIDAALLEIEPAGIRLVDALEYPLPRTIQSEIADLCHSGHAEIERMGSLDRDLGTLFARACLALLDQAGLKSEQIRAICSHGQTIRHRPPSARPESQPFTLQIGDPNTIAELTGISTVADFRRRDLAAGGEGAPLAPAFHAAAFTHPQRSRAIVNIGGIANVTLLQAGRVTGFDTGPGNTLLDLWVQSERGLRYDTAGKWASSGRVSHDLLVQLLQHSYLKAPAPKSTGKEMFNLPWLESQLAAREGPQLSAEDVQATLAEFTATTICDSVPKSIREIYVCGGGAANTDLMARIQGKSGGAIVGTTAALGIDHRWVEAAAFAWLAHQRLECLAGNLPAVTGAAGSRILGSVYAGV